MSMTDSGESLVHVLVRHVYRSITLEFTLPLEGSTVHAVKKRVEAALEEKPAPHRQRLIYLGKVCVDETAPLVGILTGGTGNDHEVREEGWGRGAGGRVGKFENPGGRGERAWKGRREDLLGRRGHDSTRESWVRCRITMWGRPRCFVSLFSLFLPPPPSPLLACLCVGPDSGLEHPQDLSSGCDGDHLTRSLRSCLRLDLCGTDVACLARGNSRRHAEGGGEGRGARRQHQ